MIEKETFSLSLLLKRVVSEEVASAGVRWTTSLGPVAGRRGASGPAHLLVWRHPAWSCRVRRHVLGWSTHRSRVATHIIRWTVGSGSAHVRISHVRVSHVRVSHVWGSGLPTHHVWIASLPRWSHIATTLPPIDHSTQRPKNVRYMRCKITVDSFYFFARRGRTQ